MRCTPAVGALLVCLLGAVAAADYQAGIPEQSAAVVKIGGCTGVCVSPAGLILSAEHCGSQLTADFESHGRHQLEVVYDPPRNNRDEAVMYHVVGGTEGFPWVAIAGRRPRVGDEVWSIGWPSEGRSSKQWEMHRGRITAVGAEGSWGMRTADGIRCDFAIFGGNSGGPLFNTEGQLIGLASTSDRSSASTWIGPESIAQAISNCPQGQCPPPGSNGGIRIGPPIDIDFGGEEAIPDVPDVPGPEVPDVPGDVPRFHAPAPPQELVPAPAPQTEPAATKTDLIYAIVAVLGSYFGVPWLPRVAQILLGVFGAQIVRKTKE